jgi:hypothetical protein
VYNILAGKPEGTVQPGRPQSRLEHKTEFLKINCDRVDRVHLAQDRDQSRDLAKMAVNHGTP